MTEDFTRNTRKERKNAEMSFCYFEIEIRGASEASRAAVNNEPQPWCYEPYRHNRFPLPADPLPDEPLESYALALP